MTTNTRKKQATGLGELGSEVLSWLPRAFRDPGELDDRSRRAAEQRAEVERAAEQHRRARILSANGFPDLALDQALAISAGVDAIETPAAVAARDFVATRMGRDTGRTARVFAGGTGAGKTSAAAFCALQWSAGSAGFIRATELERRGRYDRDGSLGKWLKASTLLVLDDLGAEPLDAKGYFVAMLDEIVDKFYADRQPLLITTNISLRQFEERYEARVLSRLLQCGTWSACGDVDLRRGER